MPAGPSDGGEKCAPTCGESGRQLGPWGLGVKDPKMWAFRTGGVQTRLSLSKVIKAVAVRRGPPPPAAPSPSVQSSRRGGPAVPSPPPPEGVRIAIL